MLAPETSSELCVLTGACRVVRGFALDGRSEAFKLFYAFCPKVSRCIIVAGISDQFLETRKEVKMETQEQNSELALGAEVPVEKQTIDTTPERPKTIKDELSVVINNVVFDTDLKLKLVPAIESYLTEHPNFSIPDLAQMLWDNFNEYKEYITPTAEMAEVEKIDANFRTELMPLIVEVATADRLKTKIQQIESETP